MGNTWRKSAIDYAFFNKHTDLELLLQQARLDPELLQLILDCFVATFDRNIREMLFTQFNLAVHQIVSVNALIEVHSSLLNSDKRAISDERFESAVRARIRSLNPAWSGEGPESAIQQKQLSALGLEEISDPDTLLRVWASRKVGNAEVWQGRYIKLGGDTTSLKYLRICIDRYKAQGKDADLDQAIVYATDLLRQDDSSVRIWIRKLYPIKKTPNGSHLWRQIVQFRIAVVPLLQHTKQSLVPWDHIVESVVFLQDTELAARVAKTLSETNRDSDGHAALRKLCAYSQSLEKEGVRIRTADWDRVIGSNPVNIGAAVIISRPKT